jgi:hypothetical protein
MLPSGKYQIARPGQPSRQMTLSEINLGLASGEVMPEDQYWVKGLPRWERVSDLSGVILPISPRTRPPIPTTSVSRPPMGNAEPSSSIRSTTSAATPANLSFWAQPETKPRLAVWSPVAYLLLSIVFTPLMGAALIAQNHRATEETVWRGIAWFWVVVWTGFLLSAASFHFAAISCGQPLYWIIGFGVLVVGWFFTSALPHQGFLRTRSFEAAWRSDWGKPVGLGFLSWVIVFVAFLLSR